MADARRRPQILEGVAAAAQLAHRLSRRSPEGLDGIDCSLADGQTIDWHGWTIRVVATPGHSRDHVAYAVRKGKDGKPLLLFCGDALAAPGKLWSPYTTDWDHWTDARPATRPPNRCASWPT